MIVCVCHNVNTSTIRAAIQIHPSLEHVRQTTGACTQCRQCKYEIECMIDEIAPLIPNTAVLAQLVEQSPCKR